MYQQITLGMLEYLSKQRDKLNSKQDETEINFLSDFL